MLKEALEYIVALRTPTQVVVEERLYSDKTLHPVQVELPEPLGVNTLSGFIDAVGMCLDGHTADDSFIHVEDEVTAALVSVDTDDWNRRASHVTARCDTTHHFAFNQYHDPEAFVIALQVNFTAAGDRDKLVKLCQSLASENVATAEDDGISQTAIVRKGAALKASAKIDPRVALAPYRTFREVSQPVSDFLFRLKSREGQPPLCALFEADGGQWKIDAAEAVRAYIAGKLAAFRTVL